MAQIEVNLQNNVIDFRGKLPMCCPLLCETLIGHPDMHASSSTVFSRLFVYTLCMSTVEYVENSDLLPVIMMYYNIVGVNQLIPVANHSKFMHM